MGTDWQIVCTDCKEYMHMGKMRGSTHWFTGRPLSSYSFDDIEKMTKTDWANEYIGGMDSVFIRSCLYFIVFCHKHEGHSVKAVTEYDSMWNTEYGPGFYGNADVLGYKEICKPKIYESDYNNYFCVDVRTMPRDDTICPP